MTMTAQPISQTEVAPPVSGISKSQRSIHRMLCLLIFTLIMEGVCRKLAPQSFGFLIFFLKDVLTLFLLVLCLTSELNAEASRLLRVMGVLAVLLMPCVAWTAVHDPVLALFGMKQYLLFPAIAVAMCQAYLPNHFREFFTLFRLTAISVIVTTGIAVAQNRLPSSNWLNLSVAGDDLSAFSAGGYLRVSATFPFVGQYCYYLNAMCFCLPAFFYFNRVYRARMASLQVVVLIGLAIIGTFVTGSRGSVIGNLSILSVAGLLCLFFAGAKAMVRLGALAAIGFVLFAVLQTQYPEFFAAYQARVDGTLETTHTVEIEKRGLDALLGWTSGTAMAPPTILGYGLGIMSNGSDKLSDYAAQWRSGGSWTEGDQATTLFEGGWYLTFAWNGFRLWVILYSISLVFKTRTLELRTLACFAMAFILVQGVIAPLAIQPPLAIWWWLAVGLVTCVARFDFEGLAEMTNQ